MRASLKIIMGLMAANLLMVTSAVAAPQLHVAFVVQTGGGDFSPPTTEGNRFLTEQLLSQAKRAMAEGNYAQADLFIRKAEQEAASLTGKPLAYTPKQARAELDSLKSGTEKPAAKPAPATPLEAIAEPAPAKSGLSSFPSLATQQPATATFAEPKGPSALAMAANGATDSQQYKTLLRDARRALAAGKIDMASNLIGQASKLNVTTKLGDDSAQIVGALIADYQQAVQLHKGGDKNAAKTGAKNLLRQAEGMMQYSDYDLARELALQAQKIPVQYSSTERTPAQLIQHLDKMRASATIRPQNTSEPDSKIGEVRALMAKAQEALDKGDVASASKYSSQAIAMKVPSNAFGDNEPRPWELDLKVRSMLKLRGENMVAQASGQTDATAIESSGTPVTPGVFVAENTLATPASATTPVPEALPAPAAPIQPKSQYYAQPSTTPTTGERSMAMQYYLEGVRALDSEDKKSALGYFKQAWNRRAELSLDQQRKVLNRLNELNVARSVSTTLSDATDDATPTAQDGLAAIRRVEEEQKRMFEKMSSEIFRERAVAEKMVSQKNPRGALKHLFDLRDRVAQVELNPIKKKQLLTAVDREINRQQEYIENNLAQIETDEQNQQRKQDVKDRRAAKNEMEQKVAVLIEDFNKLEREQRFMEAEAVARQIVELAPDLPETQVVKWKSRFIKRLRTQMALKDDIEAGRVMAWEDLERGSRIDVGDQQPLAFPEPEYWSELTERRRRMMEGNLGQSEAEVRILKALRSQKVEVRFNNMPLEKAADYLAQQTGINIFLDEIAMQAVGVTRETPVTVNLPQPVTLESALNLLLRGVNLAHTVKDEAIQVTSVDVKRANTFRKTYDVAELVVPIPNFGSTNQMGLSAAIGQSMNQAAYAAMAMSGTNRAQPTPQLALASTNSSANMASEYAQVLGQALPGAGGGAAPGAMPAGPGGFGLNPGGGGAMGGMPGMGGGVIADFQPLIELIQSTIEPDSWDEVGGAGTMQEFRQNLSLVVSQTQEVHEKIQALLEQLRRLQDLQITIEVKFITLTDDYFERIGVDFDFDLEDQSGLPLGQQIPDTLPRTTLIGTDATGLPTADFDVGFSQDSFTSAVPAFGGFDVNTAANFGFAILSDIEVFFLIQASKGDNRTNILQAPKVTLFNGQTATVNDTTQRPFVTSIIPVVGDFAAAHQPVITVLSEGTALTVNAVASQDRRFVRMTLMPFFSQIEDVEEFTFDGVRTTKSGTSVFDPNDVTNVLQDNVEESVAGTTVQLPVFAVTNVSTTVNVPDGGTVLLGGIKRLSEGRVERGVPFLSNLPYVNRLFKNVGIGRSTTSLMMMVTPRIIIQEEEEENQVPGIN